MELIALPTLLERKYLSWIQCLYFTLLVSMVVCCPFTVSGQIKKNIQDRKADTSKIFQLRQVNIATVRAGIRHTSATPVQLLKGSELTRLNSFSVADALRFFSGVQLKDYGGIGGLKTVNVRSLGSMHTAVFYDGVQLGNAQNGQVDLSRFSLDNLEEIALYNGQRSEIYQPAKAFSAASSIYMRSARPEFKPGEHRHIRVGVKSGSFGLINPSVRWQEKISPHLSANLSTEWLHADGRYKFRYTNGVYDTTARRSNTDITSMRLEAGLNGLTADSSSWFVKGYQYRSERGLPGAVVANKFDYTQRQWDRNTFIQAGYQTNDKGRYSLMVNAKYAHDYLRYLDPEYVTTSGFLDNRFKQDELYVSAAGRLHLLPVWEIALSTDYQMNKLDANLYRFPFPTRHTILTALASELKLKRFNLQASVLGSFIRDEVREYTSAGSKHEFTPAVLASWQPFDTEDFRVRAFYKSIFRMPTFNDLYYTFIGNTLLRPEYTSQYNFGLTYHHTFLHQSLVSLSVQTDTYYNRVKDKIVAVPSQNLYRWTMYNIGVVGIKGLEANIQTVWNAGNGVGIQAGVNYTYQQARDITSTERYNYNIPYIPMHSASLTLGADYKNFEFNYSYIYTGERYNQLSTDQNQVYNYMQPWYTHDVSAGYNFLLNKQQLKFQIEINNLLNQDREIIASFPMPRRFYRLKLQYTI